MLKGGCCSTQAQEISLNFHCKCEQFVHFATGSFFNFNGTAGALPPCAVHCLQSRNFMSAPKRSALWWGVSCR